jgi:hypothetical protein
VRLLIAALFLVFALAACGGEQAEDATPEEEPQAEQDSSRCLPVKPWIKRMIAETLSVQGGGRSRQRTRAGDVGSPTGRT